MIDQAQAQVLSAKAEAQRTSIEYDRASKLMQSTFGTQQRLDQALADRDRAQAAVASAAAGVTLPPHGRRGRAGRATERGPEGAGGARRPRWPDKASATSALPVIRAPFDGVVGNKAVQPGEYVQTGTRLLALVPLESAYVEANFKETQLNRLKPGQKVSIKPDAFSSRTIEGSVESVAPASGAEFSMLPPENATGNFTKIVQRVPVRIRLPADVAEEAFLRPGLSVEVEVHTRDNERAEALARQRAGARRARGRRPVAPQRAGLTAMASSVVRRSRLRPGAPAPAAAPAQGFDKRKLITFIFMVFGMFMAILDIQIVSASLAEIQAGLSASSEEVAWVQTSYLIAEVIMIPLSGILSRAFSTRYLFAFSCAGFTLMSFMCSTASSINEMILWRALQGFIGGAMIPTVFASSYMIFPKEKQPIIAPIIGLVATLAPTIGPTVGGYLTDLFSWHWLFLVNVVPGIVVSIATYFMIDFDKPELGLLENFDWTGLAGMAVFLGGMEYVLEEGPQKNWFDENIIVASAVASVIGGLVFFWRAFTAKQPIVDLRVFNNRNLAMGSIFSFVMGIGLYGLTYIYPVYLANVRGYSSLQIGETMFVSGLCMFVAAPIVGRLMGKVDPRILIGIGFTGFAIGTWQASLITKDWDFWELLVPQMLRGFSLMTAMVPINNVALGTVPPQKLKNASGLFNLTRNLGGAVGLAMINTLINNRWDLHLQRLHESVAWGHVQAEQTLANMTQAFASMGSDAAMSATKQLARLVRREALVMSLADVFLALTVLFVALVFLTPLMAKPAARAGGGGGGH